MKFRVEELKGPKKKKKISVGLYWLSTGRVPRFHPTKVNESPVSDKTPVFFDMLLDVSSFPKDYATALVVALVQERWHLTEL
jgi:hypothetical protein